MRGAALENLTGAIVELCRAGLSPEALRDATLPRLRRAVPFDAVFWATVDPATLLFTRGHQAEIPADTMPYFVRNEFLEDDVNKWTALARDRVGVRTLAQATAGDLDASARFRDIFRPLGLGDELRAVLRIQGACWGYLCLHREAGAAFTADEVRYVRRIATHLADGIRAGLLISDMQLAAVEEAPGLVVLAEDGSVISMTAAGERWLDDLRPPDAHRHDLPGEIHALATRLRRPITPDAAQPRLTVRTQSGRWAVLHASLLSAQEVDAVAVIIEEPSPSDLAPVLMKAHELTPREQALTMLVCRGLSTRELADRLHITPNTVQEHLKAIFDKSGVRSRRELVTAILQQHYRPHAIAGRPLAASGYFRTYGRRKPLVAPSRRPWDGASYRAAWVAETGELYAVCYGDSRDEDRLILLATMDEQALEQELRRLARRMRHRPAGSSERLRGRAAAADRRPGSAQSLGARPVTSARAAMAGAPGRPRERPAGAARAVDSGLAERWIERQRTSDTTASERTARASTEEPQYLVRSEKGGGEAVHEPSALGR